MELILFPKLIERLVPNLQLASNGIETKKIGTKQNGSTNSAPQDHCILVQHQSSVELQKHKLAHNLFKQVFRNTYLQNTKIYYLRLCSPYIEAKYSH